MPNFADILKMRRSIRKYTHTQVSKRLIEDLLQMASYAPSAHNAQPWRFIVITDPKQKKALAEAMAKVWLDDLKNDNVIESDRLLAAKASVEKFTMPPVIIVVCLTMDNMNVYTDEKRQQAEHDLAVQGVGAAIQNLLLKAHYSGLGSCWYCAPAFSKLAVRRILKIPDHMEPQALITLGYPAETPSMPPRRALRDFAFLNEWGLPL